jgi:hypothetical protein
MNTYSHAGVSSLNGEFKVRFCNDALRTKVLQKNGHKSIDIVELKTPMTKEDAVAYLLKIDFDNGNKAVRAALEAAADKRGVTPKAPAKVATKAKTVAKPKAKTAPKAVVPAVEPKMTVQEAMDKVGEALM